AELVDAATGIGNLLLAGVERMRVARNIHLDQGIFLTIRPLHGFLAGNRRTGQKREIAGQILENDRLVVGVGIGLHGTVPLAGRCRKKRARLYRLPERPASLTDRNCAYATANAAFMRASKRAWSTPRMIRALV